MKNYEITGSDVTELEFVPVNGVIYYGGAIKTPTQPIRIKWEVDCSSGETICPADYGQYVAQAGSKILRGESLCAADYGQYEIDCLVQAGYKILSVALY